MLPHAHRHERLRDNHATQHSQCTSTSLALHLSSPLQEADEEIVKSVDEMAINEKTEGSPVSDDGEPDDDSVEEEEEEEDDEEDDDEGWITASNIREKRREIDGRTAEDEEQKHVRVACMTTDFAMQVCTNKLTIEKLLWEILCEFFIGIVTIFLHHANTNEVLSLSISPSY